MLFFFACKKEKEVSLDYSEINSGTGYDLRCIYKLNDDTLYGTGGDKTHGIVLRSKDSGEHWEIISQAFTTRVNAIWFRNSLQAFAACDSFILMRSDDAGFTWHKVEPPPVAYQYQNHLKDVKFLNESIGFLCGGEEYAHGIIAKTVDGGEHWKYTYFDHEMRSIDFRDNLNGYCGGYGAILYTDDGGENWQITESKSEFITSISLSSSNGVACGFEGGILRNQNSFNWDKISNSNHAIGSRLHFNTVCTIDNTHYFILGNNGKCAISDDAGSSWQQANAFDDNTIYDATMLSPLVGIAVGKSGKIFRFHK